ncbi:MAG TPA: hypothetical protein VGF50_01165 [Caulobacteraceae bacterium]|jgi:hypothetical protein
MRTVMWTVLPLAVALGSGIIGALFIESSRLHGGALRSAEFETVSLVLGAAATGVVGARLLARWLRSIAARQAEAIRRL